MNAVNLSTNDEYRSNLESAEEWAAWLSEYPLSDDDPYGNAITEDEIDAYIAQHNTSIVDYAVISKYAAFVLQVTDADVEMFLVQRLIARVHSGECLATSYINNKTLVPWRCKFGHEWHAKPNDISSGQWCGKCAGNQSLTIDDMKKLHGSVTICVFP
jgi:hypothetical protein